MRACGRHTRALSAAARLARASNTPGNLSWLVKRSTLLFARAACSSMTASKSQAASDTCMGLGFYTMPVIMFICETR